MSIGPPAPSLPALSPIGLGTANFRIERKDAAFRVLDAYVELGGTLIDTAAIYGRGESERVIGEWLRVSGARDRVTLLTKGAHPDAQWVTRLDAPSIVSDMEESLSRLGVDHVDVLLVHRDDETLPVEPIIDTLQGLVTAGRTRAIGVSNWTTDRLDRAIAHAAGTGGAPIAVSSVYLGLAQAQQPLVPGCVDACDAASQAWYEASGIPLVAWASQSYGYFNPSWDATAVPFFVADTYDSPGNRERRARAQQLAARLGTTANQIALAWVLAQPCGPVALAGARDVAGVREAMGAADLKLDAADRDWLRTGGQVA